MEEALKAFVEDLKTRPECLAIAIFGSYARGQHRQNSDIDVFVVVPEGAWRDIETLNGQSFEMVYASKDSAISFYRENPNDAVQQWKDLKVIYDPKGIFEEVRVVVNEIEKQGKKKRDDRAIRHLRFDADDRIRALEYLAEKDHATANYYLSIFGEQMFDLYFDLRGLWTPPPKQRIPYLRENDKETAQLFECLFSEQPVAKRIEASKALIERVFKC